MYCQKLNQEATQLDEPPFPGELGQRIFDHISVEGWDLWMTQQTMLINEYRLNLLDQQAQDFLKKEMAKFLFEKTED